MRLAILTLLTITAAAEVHSSIEYVPGALFLLVFIWGAAILGGIAAIEEDRAALKRIRRG